MFFWLIHAMWTCGHLCLLLSQLCYQEEGWDRACCQGQPLRGACVSWCTGATIMLLVVLVLPNV
jgi:hypothetical protein